VSQANVDTVRRGYEAFNSGDIESALQPFSADIEWVVPDVLPDPGPFRGPEGVRRFWNMWQETFDDFRVEVEELTDLGENVIAQVRIRGRGKDSGVEVVTPSAPHVWTLRGGKVVRMEMFPTRAAALDALGLEGAGA
jgi:uncharacterized protein